MHRNLFICFFVFILATSSTAYSAFNGIQAIGFSKWPVADVTALADIYVSVGGDLDIRFLPKEFNPSNPYGNIDQFVRSVLPRLNGRLRIVAYMYFHDYYNATTCSDFSEPQFYWQSFADPQGQFRQQYLRRITEMNNWIKGLCPWIVKNNLQNKIIFEVCPFLEDYLEREGGTISDYKNVLWAIDYRQVNTDKVSINIGEYRCPNDQKNNQRPFSGTRLERHGKFSDVSGWLRQGDSYSNDGTNITEEQFKADQKKALSAGIHSAWWEQAFNGDRNIRACARTVAPSFGKNPALKQRILNILRSRNPLIVNASMLDEIK